MNQLVNCASAASFGGLSFGSLIRTDITLKDGGEATILTLLTDCTMFDAAVMGVGRGLKSGDVAASWRSQVFTLSNGTIKPFVKYDTAWADQIPTATQIIEKLQSKVADLQNDLNTYRDVVETLHKANATQLDDLIAAHKKIGGLKYLLESNGVEVPEYLK